MDREMKARLEAIAVDALTDISTVCQVLLATGVHMGRNAMDAALKDAHRMLAELNAKLARCREVMEANDPINARDIFGTPTEHGQQPEGAATVP